MDQVEQLPGETASLTSPNPSASVDGRNGIVWRNGAALPEWRFLHRSLVDVSHRDASTVLFGRKMAIPLIVAPTGLNELFWPHADLRLAEAAAEFGIPFAQSTMSNDPISRVARVPGLR